MSREIDDVYKRKKYKENRYDDKKSTTDDYTGERIFRGNTSNAIHKHPSHKTSDTDHITPIKVVESRYDRLSKEQQKALVNNQNHNYATVNSKLNRSKGDLENHQYLLRQFLNGTPETFQTSARMLSKEAESRITMHIEATGMYTENALKNFSVKCSRDDLKTINHVGLESATYAAIFASTLSVMQNTADIVKGDIGLNDALKNVFFDISSSATSAYVFGAIGKKLSIGDSEAGLLVAGTIQISQQIFEYIDGNVDGYQLISTVAETAALISAAHIGKELGCILGDILIPIPIVGAYIGAYLGEMITTAICNEVINTIKLVNEYAKLYQEFEKHNNKMISLYKRAEHEIRASQARLEYIIQQENEELSRAIKQGLNEIALGTQNNSFEQILSGITTIGNEFGLNEEDYTKDFVSQGSIFSNADDTLVFD